MDKFTNPFAFHLQALWSSLCDWWIQICSLELNLIILVSWKKKIKDSQCWNSETRIEEMVSKMWERRMFGDCEWECLTGCGSGEVWQKNEEEPIRLIAWTRLSFYRLDTSAQTVVMKMNKEIKWIKTERNKIWALEKTIRQASQSLLVKPIRIIKKNIK